jgi:diguanylate cyclase (GGDEF)-like protein/PAS domain S-box-containing protein
LLIVSAGGVVAFRNYSNRQYTNAIESDQLGLVTYHYFTSVWRAAQAFGPATSASAELVATEQEESLAILEEAHLRYTAEAAEERPVSVKNDIEALVTDLRQARAYILAARYQEALDVMYQANGRYYAVADTVNKASASYAGKAAHAASLARYATLAIYSTTILTAAGLYWLFRTAQRRAEQAAAEHEILRRSDARFRPLVQGSTDLIFVLDPAGAILYASPSAERLPSVRPDGAVGMTWFDFIAPDDRHYISDFLDEVRARPGFTSTAELKLHSGRDPSVTRYLQATCTNRLDDPDIGGLVLNLRDITVRKDLEQQLRHQAFHDSLTGLANRLRFTDRLEHALQRADRNGNEKVSVLYLDLDHFKNVNDDMGHSAGDALLVGVAQRILGCIRTSDTAARLGDDEFAVLLEDSRGAGEAEIAAQRILNAIKQPFHLSGREVIVTASVGVVVAEAGSLNAEEIIRDADIAMYDAKENGRGRIQVFEAGMQLSLVERINLTNELNSAVEKKELVVYYQPTILLDTERIVGFEALVRWQHPSRGLLPPIDFVALAEESGAIHALGAYVLRAACRQAREWQNTFPELSGIAMSVNVSAKQIQRPGFVAIVRSALRESGLPPENLVLEITESILIRHPQDAITTLNNLKQLGVQLALDDFGTGYSSLNYLKRFPIDILKIDRAFIEGMDVTDRDFTLVQTVIDLGHMLKLDIVAEGIERREQLNRLRDLDCKLGQGYLFARPVDADHAKALLQTQSDSPRPIRRDPTTEEQRSAAA